MANTAKIAKARLSRLSSREWSERVDLLLRTGGLSMEKLPDYRVRFKSWYLAGIPSGKVAVTILGSHGATAVNDKVNDQEMVRVMGSKETNAERKTATGYIGMAALVGALMAATGCSGIEVGGRLGLYRVDERQESQRTYRQAVPLKCYFTNCNPAPEDVQGS